MKGIVRVMGLYEDSHKYDDIINMSHHVSALHPQMSLHDRAAQFSPFAALTGYDDAVAETARLTDRRIELDEYEKMVLDDMLKKAESDTLSKYSITYFIPDKLKSGGEYVSVTGSIKKIDRYKRLIVMSDEKCISMDDILSIEYFD